MKICKISMVVLLLSSIALFCSCGKEIKKVDSDLSTSSITEVYGIDGLIIEDSSAIELSSSESSSEIVDESSSKKINDSSKINPNTSIVSVETVGPEVEIATVETYGPVVEETTSQIEEEEYIVYKPSTHYIHRSTCHWVNDECYEITDTNDIEARKCRECNPDIEIVNQYIEIVTVTTTPTAATDSPTSVDNYSRQLLAEITWHEAGSSWISIYNKACIVAGVMNRVRDSRFPNTVYGVLTARGQFSGYWPGCCTPTQACYDAVDYYFAHTSEFGNFNSWYGDGKQNHFYYQ